MSTGTFWLLAGYYGGFFAVLGAWLPYWPLYLARELGIGAEEIGLLTALAMGAKVVGPPLWGGLADGWSRRGVLVGTSWAAAVAFALYLPGGGLGLAALVAITLLYSVFQSGPLALVEATTMELVARHGGDYGRIRLWGSLGFILLALGLGPAADLWGLWLAPWVILLLLTGTACLTLFIPAAAPPVRADRQGGVARLFARPGMGWFYLSTLLMQFSHAAYYGFISLHLEGAGYSRTVIGLLWALGVIAEVVLLSHSRWLVVRFGVSLLLTGSLALAVLRWSLYAVTAWWLPLVLGQLLHAFTFGAFHVAAIQRVHDGAPAPLRATAQAWYGAFSFGIGGGLGLLLAGHWYERLGAGPLFAVMAGVAGLGVWVSLQAGWAWVSQEGT